MHDLDRALQEFGPDASEQESQSYKDNEEEAAAGYEAEESYEGEGDYEAEAGYEAERDYEADQEGGFDLAGESGTDTETVFDEIEEMEQAAALLEAQDEGELEQFLGGLVGQGHGKSSARFLPPEPAEGAGRQPEEGRGHGAAESRRAARQLRRPRRGRRDRRNGRPPTRRSCSASSSRA